MPKFSHCHHSTPLPENLQERIHNQNFSLQGSQDEDDDEEPFVHHDRSVVSTNEKSVSSVT